MSGKIFKIFSGLLGALAIFWFSVAPILMMADRIDSELILDLPSTISCVFVAIIIYGIGAIIDNTYEQINLLEKLVPKADITEETQDQVV